MNNSDNSRTISLMCELRMFRVFCVCVLLCPDGAQWDLKVSLPQSQLQLLDSRQQQLVAMTKLQPFLCDV